MKLYQILLATMLIFIGSFAKAEGAPKKNEKCIACVTKAQRQAVQRKLDKLRAENAALRDRIRELEASNENLRSNPRPAYASNSSAPVSVRTVEPKKNRISLVGGYGPTNLTNERKSNKGGNEIGMEHTPIVGAQYQRLITESVSLGIIGTVPTIPDTKKPTGLLTVGWDW